MVALLFNKKGVNYMSNRRKKSIGHKPFKATGELLATITKIQRHDLNGRWYAPIGETDPVLFKPSVTTILNVWDKGVGFETWLKNNGWRSDEIKDKAAELGTIVHELIDRLVRGEIVNLEQVDISE